MKEHALNRIKTMTRAGYTLQTMADHLNKDNVPTFSNTGKWHPGTIHEIRRQHGITPEGRRG